MLKQIDIIKTALNDVACEELPSGCDLSVEIENSNINVPIEQTVNYIIILFLIIILMDND